MYNVVDSLLRRKQLVVLVCCSLLYEMEGIILSAVNFYLT